MNPLVTHFGTHEPHKWAERLLDDLVPTISTCSAIGHIKIAEAKDKLRPHVIAMIAGVRDAERDSYTKFTADDDRAVASAYRLYHNMNASGEHFHTLDRVVSKSKLRSSRDWADRHVTKICQVASEIEGNIGSNSMADEVYRIIDNWIGAVQMCERSHHVSSNNLHPRIT